MTKEQNTRQSQWHAISELDLECIKARLMEAVDGPGWSRARADACEREYKRFLAVAARFRGETIVPSVDVDLFWHTHILDTRKYAADCEAALGFFLHHTPHDGARGDTDAHQYAAAFARTRSLQAQVLEEVGAGMSAEQGRQLSTERAAWCAAAGEAGEKVAWCAVTGKAKQNAAWCAVTGKAEQNAAWCAVTGKVEQNAAWCAVTGTSEQKAAWCAAADEADQQAAWCAVAGHHMLPRRGALPV